MTWPEAFAHAVDVCAAVGVSAVVCLSVVLVAAAREMMK